MVPVILAIIGLVLLIIGFFTHWILILLGAILLIIGAITLYRKLKRRPTATSETGDVIRIESTVNVSRQPTMDTGYAYKLNRLAELKAQGILTDEEYERKKGQIEQEAAPAEKPVPDTASEEKINQLTRLRDEGILTDEEYEQKKAQILKETAPAKETAPETAPAEEIAAETAPAKEAVPETIRAEEIAPETAPAGKPVPDTASEEKIKKLAELRDQGILTDEEYEQKKAQILKETAPAEETAPKTAPAKKTEPDAASAEKIRKLADLRDQGILTDEEYEQKKAQILKGSA